MEEKDELDLRYLLQEFYSQMVEFIYDKQDGQKRHSHLLVIDLIKVVSLGFQNPQFNEISNLMASFDESREGVLDFDEFFSMVYGLHHQQKLRVV